MPIEHMTSSEPERRALRPAIFNGLRWRCPNCGVGRLFSAYLKVADQCAHCGEELHHHRADDAPPYFTIFAVGHIVIPLVLLVERGFRPALWVHAVLWVPLILVLSLSLLPSIKGAVVAMQWSYRMHGFNPNFQDGEDVEPIDGEVDHRHG